MEYRYKGQFLFDLAGHKKFNRIFNEANASRCVFTILYCVFALWMVHQFTIASMVRYFLIFALALLIFTIASNPKKGNIYYKRMLQANNNQPIVQDCFFTDDSIHIINHPSENHLTFAYDQLCYGILSENLLVFVLKHRSCLVIDMDTLAGGSIEDLYAFIKERAPKFKGNRPRKTHLGKWSKRTLALILAVGSIWALMNISSPSLADRLLGRMDNSMTYQEMADELTSLDIYICSRVLREINEYDEAYLEQVGEEYYLDAPRYQKVADLLYWEGEGTPYSATWWDPSNSGVYWIPVYFEDSVVKYEDFLTGLNAMDDTLVFSDIHEDRSNVDENGNGSVTLTFTYQGNPYCIEIEDYYYRYFDSSVIRQVGDIIATDSNRLYVSTDNYEGFLLYYGTAQQVRELNRRTQLNFKKSLGIFW